MFTHDKDLNSIHQYICISYNYLTRQTNLVSIKNINSDENNSYTLLNLVIVFNSFYLHFIKDKCQT